MECEVCGRNIESPVYVRIEGTEMRTCSGCAKFGILLKKGEQISRKSPGLKSQREEIVACIPNYGATIRKAREKLGLTQEELGKKINEKVSVITRLESEKMVPDANLAKKLGRFLGMKVLEKAEEEAVEKVKLPRSEFTIGDMIKVKRGEQ